MIDNQANFLQSLGWAVISSLWQMALLWIIYQVFSFAFKSAKSSFKSTIATFLLFTGFAWFVYTFLSVYTTNSPEAIIGSSSFFNESADGELNNWLQRSLPVASFLYLILLFGPVSGFIRNYRYVQIIRKYGLQKINVEWRMFVMKIAAQMSIKKPVHIWISEYVTSPVTVGFLKPMILVPIAAINHLTPQQLEAVLLHELSHIRRHDYLINLLLNLVQTILYFNPFVMAFKRIVEREREKSCDEMVLQFQYNSFEYASALLTLEKQNNVPQVLTMASGGKRYDLLHRVESIMGIERKKPAFSLNRVSGFMAGLICIFLLNGLTILNQSQKKQTSKNSFWATLPSLVKEDNEQTDDRVAAIVENETANEPVVNSLNSPGHNQHPAITNLEPEAEVFYNENAVVEMEKAIASAIQPVAFEPIIAAELKQYQEEQVKEALEASKKVLENAQWKYFEKNIADVFTKREKEELKKAYQNEVNRFDWGKWENKLKAAYEKVDWDNVNYQLTNAVNQIKIDSLQKVYNNVLVKLNDVQMELSLSGLEGIPDSDITLKEVERKKQEAMKTLNELKLIRNKKVVHL